MGHALDLAFRAVNSWGPKGPRSGAHICNHPWRVTVIGARPTHTSPYIEMRILLLGASSAEPTFRAWYDWLTRAGVPFDAVALDDQPPPVTVLDQAGNARFQALILASGGLVQSALDASQCATLEQLERECGLRRLTAYAYPGPEYGVNPPAWAGPLESGSATLTARGREVFPYLRDELPVDPGSWAYLGMPAVPKRFETLVAGPDQSVLLGVHRHADGREEMVQMFDANVAQTQGQLLRSGQLAWLTRGTYVGLHRNYLSLHIDDVLLPNYVWNMDTHQSDLSPQAAIRMTAEDARRAASWSRSRGLRLDLVCNGAGSRRHMLETGAEADPLLNALLAEREAFGWINHTYEHLNLDRVPQATIETEIARNFDWAREMGIDFERQALVTGAHTGLANLASTPPSAENVHLAAALKAQRIRHLACDGSRPYPARQGGQNLPPGTPFMIGDTIVVPRHPTILPDDAATEAQAFDRLRDGGRTDADSWPQVIESEAKRIFGAVMSNDPRPHFFHQSNLIGADDGRAPGIVYRLLEAVLERYERYVAPQAPIVQPTLAEIGRLLLALQSWQVALTAGSIRCFMNEARVTIVNSASVPLEVPLTGTSGGEEHGLGGPGWILVMPGETVLERQPER
jgi:hypothetical protein